MPLHGLGILIVDGKGWCPKMDIDIFKEPENQRVFLDNEVYKKMIFIQPEYEQEMQGLILM